MYGCIHAPGIAASGIARHFSSLVEAIDPSTVVMDLAGMERLLGSPRDIAVEVTRKAGPQARVGIASSLVAAVHAALGLASPGGFAVLSAGEEADGLALLPVTLLEASEEVRAILSGWGQR